MQDELVERVARQIAPSAWLSFDARCERKEFTPEEVPGELAQWLADHPHGAMAASLAKARAIIPIVAKWQRKRDAQIVRSFPAPADDENTALRMERLKERIATAIRNQEQTDG